MFLTALLWTVQINTESIFEIYWAKKKKESIDTEDIIVDEVSDNELLDLIPNNYDTYLIKNNILYYISYKWIYS